ncbi:MAG: ankyrin repeat domain-containing protein [Leptospira sp.]|nr:ankyrin repeat domain-containing protein [Leptospira sp.]
MISKIRKLILEYRFNATVRSLYTSIENADINNFHSTLKKLKENQNISDFLPMLLCFTCEHSKESEILITLLELGIHPDTPNQSDRFPIHEAVENGNEEFVKILLRFGANPNIIDKNGVTPLHISYSYDSLGGISDLLVSNGADLTLRDSLGKRYLM